MERNISRSHKLARTSHPFPVCRVPRGRHRCGCRRGGWGLTFPNVKRLSLGGKTRVLDKRKDPFVSFHNISSVLKSLCVASGVISPSSVSKLVCSLPLLEDFEIWDAVNVSGEDNAVIRPSTSSPLTGTLTLCLFEGWNGSHADYWTYRMVFTFGVPRARFLPVGTFGG